MQAVYTNYKKRSFPKLLEDPLIPEDKRKLEVYSKPWNLYIRRHTAATEMSKKLKDSVLLDSTWDGHVLATLDRSINTTIQMMELMRCWQWMG
jgi:hypothetical protein